MARIKAIGHQAPSLLHRPYTRLSPFETEPQAAETDQLPDLRGSGTKKRSHAPPSRWKEPMIQNRKINRRLCPNPKHRPFMDCPLHPTRFFSRDLSSTFFALLRRGQNKTKGFRRIPESKHIAGKRTLHERQR
ncbi:hypothetical protein DY000_02044268 [Brassica cretica]|uniref:Uncharacterized protein n=1 Tax=Brassica cretica TaxID=69181 RepID=A0ABQ7F711_BRACR|nr:hypothetical protein DY000_02044268 [Brassica cretica]